jgi:hypothetical protein
LKEDRSKEAGRWELKNWKWEIKHRQLLTMGLDQITKFVYRLDEQGPLMRVLYIPAKDLCGFQMPAALHVLVLVSAHPKVH